MEYYSAIKKVWNISMCYNVDTLKTLCEGREARYEVHIYMK